MNQFDEEEMPAMQEEFQLPKDWDDMLKVLDEVIGHEEDQEIELVELDVP